MNYIFIIIAVIIIIFWVINDLFNFFEFFNAGICTTSNGTYGNFYDNICHPFTGSNSSVAPSSNSTYIPPNQSGETGSWENTGIGAGADTDTEAGEETEAGTGAGAGSGAEAGTVPLSNTTNDDCIDNKYKGTICKIRNPSSNNYGLKSIISCTGTNNTNKSKFECAELNFNQKDYKNNNDVINATSCINNSIDFNEACRIFQPINANLKTQGYNVNSIGSKEVLYGINGDCYDSYGNEDVNKARVLCSYKYNTNMTKLDHVPNNYDYNVFTGCKNIKSNFNQECETLLGKTDKVYAYINGSDCLPGFGRAKCVDLDKPINQTENMRKFMLDSNIQYFRDRL
jgi:hypothetical protein